MSILNGPPAELCWAIDLAPGDSVADWFLAKWIMAIDDPGCRIPTLQALGMARVATALRLRAVHEDAFGRLFHSGDRRDPSAFVVVRDRAAEADGTAIEHWNYGPPHMVTA